VKKSAVGTMAMAFPAIVPSTVFGSKAPSERIHLACIGTGNQGFQDLKEAMHNDDVQMVAVCDVNRASYGYRDAKQYCGWEPAQRLVEEHYAKKERSGKYKGCDAYTDFRDVLDREDVDAVLIVTPDHWHAIMTLLAAQKRKDIYCEKPLSLTVADGRMMAEAVRRYGVVLQTGTQRRSSQPVRFACELVRNGRIGQLKRIIAHVAENNKTCPPGAWEPTPVPEGFDYEMWLGPAPWEPYHEDRCFYTFRFIDDYSGGQTTNFGAHSIDMAQWGHGTDDTGPVQVKDLGAVFPPDGLFNTATHVHFSALYEDGVELICKTANPSSLCRFEGTEGVVETGFGGVRSQPESLVRSVIGPDEIHLYEASNHMRNFLDCVRSRQEPSAPVEVGHRTATICHLGNIAMSLRRTLRWDPTAERLVGDEESNSLLSRPAREPWNWV